MAVEFDACQRAEEPWSVKPSNIREVAANDDEDTGYHHIQQQTIALLQKLVEGQNRSQEGAPSGVSTSAPTACETKLSRRFTCYNCGEKAHIRKNCPKRHPQEGKANETKRTENVKNGGGKLATIQYGLYIPAFVNSVRADLVINTGAAVTIISFKMFDKICKSLAPIYSRLRRL